MQSIRYILDGGQDLRFPDLESRNGLQKLKYDQKLSGLFQGIYFRGTDVINDQDLDQENSKHD
jgi:hypothetical protein